MSRSLNQGAALNRSGSSCWLVLIDSCDSRDLWPCDNSMTRHSTGFSVCRRLPACACVLWSTCCPPASHICLNHGMAQAGDCHLRNVVMLVHAPSDNVCKPTVQLCPAAGSWQVHLPRGHHSACTGPERPGWQQPPAACIMQGSGTHELHSNALSVIVACCCWVCPAPLTHPPSNTVGPALTCQPALPCPALPYIPPTCLLPLACMYA